MVPSITPPFQVRTAGLIQKDPYHSTPGTRGSDIMLTIFLAGRGIYRNKAGRRDIEPNTVGLVSPDDPGILMAEASNPYTHYYCRFCGSYAVHLARQIVEARGARFFHAPNCEELADRVRRMGPVYRTVLPGEMGHLEILLAEVLVMLAHPSRETSSTFSLASLEQYLLDHLAEPHNLTRMAEHFHLSKASLCRLTKKLCGRTIVEISEAKKIEWAKILLESGTLNVTEVARRVGYPDPFYFSRVFKRHTGLSPQHWLRACLKSR